MNRTLPTLHEGLLENTHSFSFNMLFLFRFEVKSMAGNIIPAIATTNAVIAGCIVMEAIKILNNQVFIETFFLCNTFILFQEKRLKHSVI